MRSLTSSPLAFATRRRLRSTGASRSIMPAASGPVAILSMYTRRPGAYMLPRSDTAITDSAPGAPAAVRVVPSTGSTATSTCGP